MRRRQWTVALLPRRRAQGSAGGELPSRRRGDGRDVVGLREYVYSDDPRRLDHRASARATLARASETLLVREYWAEEAAHVVLVLDRRASMRLYPEPWLQKPAAVVEIVRLIAASSFEARSPVGCLQIAADDGVRWSPPGQRPQVAEWTADAEPAAADSLGKALEALVRIRPLNKGTFVFVVSDFLAPPAEGLWTRLLARGCDPVPVLVQDPTWEQSFPDVGGVPFPVTRANGGRVRLARLTKREAADLRSAHEGRLRQTLERFQALTLDPLCIGAAEPRSVLLEFKRWTAGRARRRR